MVDRPIEHVPVGGKQVFGFLEGGGHPTESAFEPTDAQLRVSVDDASKDVTAEHFPGSAAERDGCSETRS
jgi:hypothetical protein